MNRLTAWSRALHITRERAARKNVAQWSTTEFPPDALKQKLRRFTVVRGTVAAGAETIVLAQPGEPIDEAFRKAEVLVRGETPVRLIGQGVTLTRTWPDWVKEAEGLSLTEWGALQYATLGEMTIGLQAEMRHWIRSIADDIFDGLPSDRILFASACSRFFQRVVLCFPIARALAVAFPGATVLVAGQDPWLRNLLETVASHSDPRHAPHTQRHGHRVWAARIIALGSAALAASAIREIAEYITARASFNMLARLRRRQAAQLPNTWIGAAPDWYRINQHLLRALAVPETDTGGTIGIILVSTLSTGLRDEANMRIHHPSPNPWPGLGPLAERFDRCVVEQAVLPERLLAFVRATLRGLMRSAVLLRRLARSPLLDLPSVQLSHSEWTRGLVTWATVDVVRATLAQAAADLITARLGSAVQTFSVTGSGSPNIAAVDLSFQREGVTTFDHPHGAGGDSWTGASSTSSSIRCVWTLPDSRAAEVGGQATLVTGMPAPERLSARTRPARRILMMSNYVHRDAARDGHYPLRAFQDELLDVIPLLRARGHADKEFRWRPHPADDQLLVALEAKRHPGLALSRGVAVEEDAAWADLVVSSISTTLIEVLFAGVPVFVHALPEHWGTPVTSFIDPSRLFFRAADGADAISSWLDQHGSDAKGGLAQEEKARVALFGATGEPVPMTEYFGRSATRRLPIVGKGRGS